MTSPAADSIPDMLSLAVAAFLAEKTAELSPYSVTHLQVSLCGMARALGDPLAGAVTYADLRSYVDGLRLRYRPGTLRPVVGDIRQFWRWAKRRGWTDRNPAKRLRGPSRRVVVESAAPKAADEGCVRRLFENLAGGLSGVVWRDLFGNLCAAPDSDWSYHERTAARDLFVLAFLYETGCRAGELWRLSRRAMVHAASASGPVYHVTSTGKTGEVVLRFAVATLEVWSVWDAIRPAGGDGYAVVGWRLDHAPAPMSTATLSRMLARRCERAGVAPFRAHALRHAKIRRGKGAVGLETTSRLIGHGSAVMTAAYAVADADELTAAALATALPWRLWT